MKPFLIFFDLSKEFSKLFLSFLLLIISYCGFCQFSQTKKLLLKTKTFGFEKVYISFFIKLINIQFYKILEVNKASKFNKSLLFILILIPQVLVFQISANAQKIFAQGGKIHDYGNEFKIDSFPIVIKGLPSKINSDFGLAKICFNINHRRVSDLKVELVSPDGSKIWITNRNGGDGSQYMSTCFRANGFSGYIHQGKAPFEGEYSPDGRIEFINNNQNPNGTWYLLIQDLKKDFEGDLNIVSLEFTPNPTPNLNLSPCSIENGENCECLSNKSNCELLPDLIILESFTKTQIVEYAHNDKNYPGLLMFAASIANIGEGPMEILGKHEWVCGNKLVDSMTVCDNGQFARQKIYQRIYKKNQNKITFEDKLAGTDYFDNKPGHNHYHVDDWVEFRLYRKEKDKNNKIVKRLVTKKRKVSYCLWDTGICNNADSLCNWKNKYFGEQNLKNYGLGNYADCHSQKQGISVGGYDTYGYMYEGQFLQLPKGLKKGTYYLEIEIDPDNIYKEKDKSNNIFSMPVVLAKQ